MKNKNAIIVVIVLLSICILLLAGLLYVGLTGNSNRLLMRFKNNSNEIKELIYDETYFNDPSKIVIDADAANILIKRGNQTKVVVYGKKDLLTVEDEEEISIHYEQKPCRFFCFNIDVGRIEVYLNEEYDGLIKIKSDYGDINIEEFMESQVEIDSAYGDTSVLGARKTTINSSAGDIKIGRTSIAKLDNNYGNIKIEEIDYMADINADCGDIKIEELNIKENSNINNNFGNIKIKSTNDIFIDADISLGDKKINNNNPKSDIVLNISNNCGDIKVN